jgi:hypothetical protein
VQVNAHAGVDAAQDDVKSSWRDAMPFIVGRLAMSMVSASTWQAAKL